MSTISEWVYDILPNYRDELDKIPLIHLYTWVNCTNCLPWGFKKYIRILFYYIKWHFILSFKILLLCNWWLRIRLNTTYFAENWKYYNKIIFKCVNSDIEPIFNIFFFWIKWLWIPWTVLWGSKNLGPCSGFKYHILPIMRPRRGNHRETS